jgi:hypothetical protein
MNKISFLKGEYFSFEKTEFRRYQYVGTIRSGYIERMGANGNSPYIWRIVIAITDEGYYHRDPDTIPKQNLEDHYFQLFSNLHSRTLRA